MPTAHDLLLTAYTSFNARDIDSALQTMHSDVDWPNGMEGGRVHGHSGVREYWTRQWAQIDPHVEPVAFSSDASGRTVIDVHQVVRDLSGTIILDQMVQHIYSLQDGLIHSMEIRESSSN